VSFDAEKKNQKYEGSDEACDYDGILPAKLGRL
jgi:hypothetical protein